MQKYLARSGVSSRRKCEELITAGRVTVNGEVVAELGSRVKEGDVVCLDGSAVEPEPLRYLLLNKPAGVVSAVSDPQGRETVIDLAGGGTRLFPVGRLDIDTTGLLLLTNDGGLAHALMHPSFEVDKVYVAETSGVITGAEISRLEDGVELEDGMTSPAKARVLKKGDCLSVVELVIHEGRKRQVRRMLEALGHTVHSLHRSRYAMLTDEGMAPGDIRELSEAEVEALSKLVTRGR